MEEEEVERRERGKRSQFFAARFFSFLFLSLLLLALEDPEGLERRRSTGRGEGERGRSGQSEWQLEEERGEGRRFFFLFDFGACSPLARRAGASPAPPSALFPSPSAKVLEAGAREGRGRSPGVRKVGLTGARSFQAGFFFFCGRHRVSRRKLPAHLSPDWHAPTPPYHLRSIRKNEFFRF